MRNVTFGVVMSVMLCGLSNAQDTPLPQAGVTTSGIVVSSTPSTLVVKSGEDTYQLFTFYKDTVSPSKSLSAQQCESSPYRGKNQPVRGSPRTSRSSAPRPRRVNKQRNRCRRMSRKWRATSNAK